MASSDDPLLRLQRTAYMTPRRRSPSIVDAVDRPREQTTPFSPESSYPTPPESSPWQACHQTGSATISRPAPLKLLGVGGERNAIPQTPQRRVDGGIHSSFTPFHDIKQDIDKLIGELPIGSEDLVKSQEETVVERSEIRTGKHLSLFLYSPSKKKPLEPTGEDVFGSGEGFELIGEETLALPCINSSAPTDLEHQQQPVNRSLLSKASCVFKKTIKFIVPRGLHRLSRGNTSCEVRLEGEEEEEPRQIQLPPTKQARSIPMRNPPPGCCHHSQLQTLPTSNPGASNSILLLPIMSNNSISSPPQPLRRRRQEQQQHQQPQQQPQPQQPKSIIRRKPVPKVPPPKYPAAATPPHHVATTIRGRRSSTILRIHNVPSYIVHQDDFFHPHPHHHHHRFSPPESKSNSSSSNRIQSLHASIYDFDVDDPMMPPCHHQEEEKQQQKAQKGQKNPPRIPLSETPLYIQAAASLCIMAIAAGADFLVEDDSSYGYSWGVGRKMGSWTCSSRRRRVGCCKISERRR